MRACREGGAQIESALRSLDRAYFAVLYRECARAVHNADLARDLVQETFIRIWRRCATFRGDSELLPWIRAVMRRAILDQLRRQPREEPLETRTGLTAEALQRIGLLSSERAEGPDQALRQRQLALCFERCWERFMRASPEHALVIAWIAEDGLTHEEIARLLGRTPGATREFISQCRKRARVHLAEWYALAFTDEPA